MTFQSSFMVVAPLDVKRVDELRSLLATMNRAPGTANPDNEIIPFGRLPDLHFARIVVLEDQTLDDITTAYGIPRRNYPLYLTFLADFDGEVDRFRNQMVSLARKGLEQIFSYCTDFKPGTDIIRWMEQHEHRPATMYNNWVGRTMQQIREENALRQVVQTFVFSGGTQFQNSPPEEIRRTVKAFVEKEVNSKKLTLTPTGNMPLMWRIKKLVNLIFVPLLLLFITPLIILYLPIFVFQLRRREKSDMEIAPRPPAEYVNKLARIEDYDVSNQFTAMGSLKPGLFRRWLLIYLLWIIQYTTRHVYTRGHLARVSTIHFARWVFIDNKKRLVFCSNYDSSLETYMDDFINKVAFGLNVVFSNGIGYPTTNWLVFDGAKDEQKFKYFIRRHELPTEVWYDGHTGLTNFDLKRNSLIRNGLEQPVMTNAQAVQWLQLL
ncbi:MAG TPA: hypothetical protein VJR02_00750 [Pyrinomonadaceae bacterium]|nr:hypothetical protein [Pyrinomonadaceae bacterium]